MSPYDLSAQENRRLAQATQSLTIGLDQLQDIIKTFPSAQLRVMAEKLQDVIKEATELLTDN